MGSEWVGLKVLRSGVTYGRELCAEAGVTVVIVFSYAAMAEGYSRKKRKE